MYGYREAITLEAQVTLFHHIIQWDRVRKGLQPHREWPGIQDSNADGVADTVFGWFALLGVLRGG